MTKIDGKHFVESFYLEADLDCSTIDNHDGSVNFGNVRERNGRNRGGGNSKYKVFEEMSSIKSIEQNGKEIKDDVVIESNDENEVIDNTGLMGFAEASNENVNGKRMEFR
nr:hypothetical protein [Tanacetum cinerariifolium]